MSGHEEEVDRAALRASAIPRSWFDRIIWAGGALSALVIIYILGLTAAAVFARYVLGSPFRGADEQTGFLVVATVMAGAAEALRRGDHISVDLLTGRLPEPAARVAAVFGYAAVLLFAFVLLVTAWRSVTFSYQFGAYSDGALQLPMWLPQSAMVVGAALLVLASVVKIAAVIRPPEQR